ncbi:uncharacterized protein LOC142973856 [Anticarsia gemmatalis]|uniref:uncharacterized protein LOC142973856 n=1 Tax=Anticarsia gemmatalis TaxID=129554 RepID=UPI003F765291
MSKLLVSVFLINTIFYGVVHSRPSDDGESVHKLKPKGFKMPKACKEKGMEYCFENDNYPIDIVKEVVKDMKNLVQDDVRENYHYSNRQGDLPECPYNRSNDAIYYVEVNNKDRVVIQLKDKFEQRTSLEWCTTPGRVNKTTHFVELNLVGTRMYCENKYMDYDFLVLSLNKNLFNKYTVEQVRIKTGIPICCACRYYKE